LTPSASAVKAETTFRPARGEDKDKEKNRRLDAGARYLRYVAGIRIPSSLRRVRSARCCIERTVPGMRSEQLFRYESGRKETPADRLIIRQSLKNSSVRVPFPD